MIEIGVFLCPGCGGYAPLTEPGYQGQMSGTCTSCLLPKREVHRFIAHVPTNALGPCACMHNHQRREAAA